MNGLLRSDTYFSRSCLGKRSVLEDLIEQDCSVNLAALYWIICSRKSEELKDFLREAALGRKQAEGMLLPGILLLASVQGG